MKYPTRIVVETTENSMKDLENFVMQENQVNLVFTFNYPFFPFRFFNIMFVNVFFIFNLFFTFKVHFFTLRIFNSFGSIWINIIVISLIDSFFSLKSLTAYALTPYQSSVGSFAAFVRNMVLWLPLSALTSFSLIDTISESFVVSLTAYGSTYTLSVSSMGTFPAFSFDIEAREPMDVS